MQVVVLQCSNQWKRFIYVVNKRLAINSENISDFCFHIYLSGKRETVSASAQVDDECHFFLYKTGKIRFWIIFIIR